MKNSDAKVTRILKATIELISTNGLANTSVANIARLAGVSDGYLYRYYTGKDELVGSVFRESFKKVNSIIEDMLKSSVTIEQYVDKFTDMLYSIAVNDPCFFKFLVIIQNDFSFVIDEDIIGKVRELCGQILERCSEGGYRDDLTIRDIYMIFIVLPQQYVAMGLRKNFMGDMSKKTTIEAIRKNILCSITNNKKQNI